MARNPRSDGTKFAREAAADLTKPLPEPLLPLTEAAQKYWPRIIRSKRIAAWTPVDLDLAANLAEDLATLAGLRLIIRDTPPLTEDAKGRLVPHPAFALIDEIQKRVISLNRAIQIHALATSGPAEDQKHKNSTVRDIGTSMDDAPARLIPRPKISA